MTLVLIKYDKVALNPNTTNNQLLMTTQEAFVESAVQDQTAQNVHSNL